MRKTASLNFLHFLLISSTIWENFPQIILRFVRGNSSSYQMWVHDVVTVKAGQKASGSV